MDVSAGTAAVAPRLTSAVGLQLGRVRTAAARIDSTLFPELLLMKLRVAVTENVSPVT